MKNKSIILILFTLMYLSMDMYADTYSLTSCMFGRDQLVEAYEKSYSGEDAFYSDGNEIYMLCPYGGNYTMSIDHVGTITLNVGSMDSSTGVITWASTTADATGGRHISTLEGNSAIGLFKFAMGASAYLLPYSSTYIIHHENYTQKNYTAGEEAYLPYVNWYSNTAYADITFAYDGVIFENKSNFKLASGYGTYLSTIPALDDDVYDYFTITNYNHSSFAQYWYTDYLFYSNGCSDLEVSSYSPDDTDSGWVIGYLGSPTIFMISPGNIEEGATIEWKRNYGTVLSSGDSTNNILSWTPTQEGKQFITAELYNPVCDQLVFKTWTVYVNPEITLKGTCSCNGNKVPAFPICFKRNDSAVYECTGSTDLGEFTISLPEGIYNLTVDDRDYVFYNTTLNLTLPPYISSLPVEQYITIDLTSKNITGERLISFNSDGACDGHYFTALKNVSFNLYTLENMLVFSFINGVLSDKNDYYVPNYSYTESTSTLNLTLTQGDYYYVVSKSGYYPASNQDNHFSIDSLDNQIYGYSQRENYFMENLSCSYLINYTIYTYTYDSGNKSPLSGVKLDFYNYFTDTYNSTGYSDITGKYERNYSEKYIKVIGTKDYFGADDFEGEILPGDNISLILKRTVPVRDLRGAIYDCANNLKNPLSEVELRLFSLDDDVSYESITGDDGKFLFKNIPEGDYYLNYSKYGYGSKKINISLSGMDWVDYSTQCLSFNTAYCVYELNLFAPDNSTLYGLELQAISGLDNSMVKSEVSTELTSTYYFTLPRLYGTQGNEIGYKFRVIDSGYIDNTEEKTYSCTQGKISKYLVDSPLLPFTEEEVLDFIDKYMWGIFLVILLLFCTYIGALMVRGIIK